MAVVTKAVVANWVVLVPGEAVGAVGTPVNVGETEDIAPLKDAVVPESTPVTPKEPPTDAFPTIPKLPVTALNDWLKLVLSQ
jgi:hypothetical protein